MDPHPPVHARRGRLLFEVPIALVLALAGIYFVLRTSVGDGGVALLADHQVLVRVNNLAGELSADDRPGQHTFVPWFEQVYRLDRRTMRYVMGEGGEAVDRRAPSLVVRGRGGSSFAFGRVEIQAALDPARADLALIDHGGDRQVMTRLIDAYARPVLRDAFGRYTPREVVLPDNKQAATERALGVLSAALARHGIRVLELSVSKPKFADKYQETIQRRKVAEQDTERLAREREELRATAGERELAVRDIEEQKLADLGRELEEKLRLARRAADTVELLTGIEVEDRLAAATLAMQAAEARAAVIEERHRAEADAFRARLAAIESQGELAVRAALVERLGNITFELAPYERREGEEQGNARRTAHEGGVE